LVAPTIESKSSLEREYKWQEKKKKENKEEGPDARVTI
jgi:hypothetical protein